MFVTLRNVSICISVNEWTLNSIQICYYFGLHFGWWTKLLNWVQDLFHLFPNLSKRKTTWSEVSNSREFNASTTMKAFTNSFFNFSTTFLKFSTSTTIIKHEKSLFLIRTNTDRVYALDTRFRAYPCIKLLLCFIHASRGNPTKNLGFYWCWSDERFDCHLQIH